MIGRRYVLYVEGYDPQGAAGYYRLFARELMRSAKTWSIRPQISALASESEEFAAWTVETTAPNWRVSTRYEFLRLEHVIRANMARPILLQLAWALAWMSDDLFSGTLKRVFRASWRFGLNFLWPQLFILGWLAVTVATGAVASTLASYLGTPAPAAAIIALGTAALVFASLRRLADKLLVIQVASSWVFNRAYAHGRPSCFDAAIEAAARRLVAVVGAAETDEVLLIGHSSGAGMAPLVLARAAPCRRPSCAR